MPPSGATGPLARDTVTLLAYAVARLPKVSSARTVTAGAMSWPATALVGCCWKARVAALPGVMAKLDEAGAVRVPSLATSV